MKQQTKRILFWSGTFYPKIGGPQVLASKLLPELRERGYEFMVISPQEDYDLPSKAHYKGIPVYRFPFWDVLKSGKVDQIMGILQEVSKLKQTFKPDLVHITVPGFSDFFHLRTARVHKEPLLVTLHGEWDYLSAGNESLAAQTLRSADWVTGCSAAILSLAWRLVPENITRSSVIYNGIEAPPLPPSKLIFNTPVLLCLGRLEREKGFDLAIDAFASILTRFPKARLIIAGDGLTRTELEEQAARLGLDEAVEFTGWVNPDLVPSLINNSTLVIIPSRRDSLPLVALEAALMERPVVATHVGGLPEAVVHQETGLLVEEENSHVLSEAIISLLNHQGTAIQMGQAARRRAQEVFNWKRCIDAYDSMYRKVISGATRETPIRSGLSR